MLASLLLERGVAVDTLDGFHWTALMLAVYAGHEPLVRLLLRQGADTTLQTPGVGSRGRDVDVGGRALGVCSRAPPCLPRSIVGVGGVVQGETALQLALRRGLGGIATLLVAAAEPAASGLPSADAAEE